MTTTTDEPGAGAGAVRPRAVSAWEAHVARVGQPAAHGTGLLVVAAVIIVLAFPLQVPDPHRAGVVAAVCGALVLLAGVGAALPWQRWPERACLLFPAAVMTAVCLLSTAGDGTGAAYTGLFMLGFAYVGAHLPVRTCWWLLPLAVPLYGPAAGGWSHFVVSRLVVAVLVWVVVTEVLATLAHRHRTAIGALSAASRTDALTALDNRRALEDHLDRAAAGTVFAVCDLDHFKRVNDAHGHAAGDAVLADFAGVLAEAVRHGDHAVRYGGEEFLLLLRVEEGAVPQVLARLHQRWSLVHSDITFSCGWAVHDGVRSARETLAAADEALYEAKRLGRDRDAVR